MVEAQDKKEQITAGLTAIRTQMYDELLLLRRDLNVGRHVLGSIRKYTWEWMASAAVCGWLLSRLPARKKKIYVYDSNEERLKSSRKKPLATLWQAAWDISKPLIAAYIAKKIAEKAKIPGSKWL